ncbi:MAG: hypothetical protein KOO60_02000 [Gemmatimonadales bacterium]|nr:hypothetical protein [Gemmatimonadales bacterium]
MPLILLALIGLMVGLGGCSEDDPTEIDVDEPQATVAASLSQPTQTVAAVEENLRQLDLFENPLNSLASDVGLYQDPDFEGWTGEGMSFPDQGAALAAAMRRIDNLKSTSVKLATADDRPRQLAIAMEKSETSEIADGDTLFVEHFAAPDSSGLNALIVVTAPDLVRFVVQREYPPTFGKPVRFEQEIVMDTNGTLEDDTDDLYHSATHEVEMTGGEIAYGHLAPVSGEGPMQAGVQVLAHSRVENPRWHILQAWNETDIIMDTGDFRTDGDETIYSFEVTVHWRNDAEYTAQLAASDDGPIQDADQVRALGFLTAAPTDNWLESISDTMVAVMGDLDDESDDLLVEMSRGTVFDGIASDGGQPRNYVHILPSEPVAPGEEPCGGLAEQDVWYPAAWWLVHLQREADIDCDGSGTLHELRELRDGSSFERTITWDGSGNATITENRLDGTQVTGTFNESTGEYSIATVFPAGNDPVSRHQSGQSLETGITATDVFVWQDAHADSTSFAASGDETEFTITGYKVRGDLREDFTISVIDGDSITGVWSRNDGASGDFTLEQLEGGSSHLVFSATDSQAEGNPSVTGDLWFAPDGSGTGTITFTQFGLTVTYEITFGPDGAGVLDDGEGNLVAL